MKQLLLTLPILACAQALAQSGQTAASQSSNCEDLVFNTRELTQFAYNTRCKTESYPFLSADGKKLYFTNNQTKDWVFYTQMDSNRVWSVPVPLKIDNWQGSMRSAYLDEASGNLYFTSGSGLYKCSPVEGSAIHFSGPETISITSPSGNSVYPFSALSFSPDMQEMYAYLGSSSVEKPKQHYSMGRFVRSAENAYTFTAYVSTSDDEIGVLCNKGLSYIFTNDEHNNLLFMKTRNTLSESFGSTVYLLKEFEHHLDINQVRYAEQSGELVLVLSQNLWERNDVYFLDAGLLPARWTSRVFSEEDLGVSTLLTETEDRPVMVPENEASSRLQTYELTGKSGKDIIRLELGQPFPNPAGTQFFIYYNISAENPEAGKPELLLINNSGQTVHRQALEDFSGEARIMPPGGLRSGIYYIRLDYSGVSSPSCKVTLNF